MPKKIPSIRTFLAVPSIVAITGGFASSAIITSYFDNSGKSIDFISEKWAKSIAAVAGMKIETVGAEKIDTSRTYVIVSNHQSHMDTICLYATCPVPVRMLAKQELSKIFIFGRAMDKAGHIWITRDKSKKTDFSKLIHQVDRLKKASRSVVVFAEGSRCKDGKIQPFKKGAFKIAKHFNLPILPVAIDGTHKILPAKSFDIMKGQVKVTYNEVLETENYEIEELMEKSHGAIESCLNDNK